MLELYSRYLTTLLLSHATTNRLFCLRFQYKIKQVTVGEAILSVLGLFTYNCAMNIFHFRLIISTMQHINIKYTWNYKPSQKMKLKREGMKVR